MELNDLFKVNVDDVAPEKRENARGELADHFKPFSRGLKIPIEIIVTRSFDETVKRILSNKLGFEIHYNAKRKEVIAIAKTIPYLQDDRLGFTVIFDASAFGAWENEQCLWRRLTFSHETAHIISDKALYDDIGPNVFISEPITVEDTFFRLAHDIWMEYYAERLSLEIFIEALKEVFPNAIASFSSHEKYAKSFINLLETLPDFIYKNIDDFRNQRITMDVFWPRMYFELRETLVLAAFTSAHTDALNKIDEKLAKTRQNGKYSFFFSIWQSIESDLRALYHTDKRYDKEMLVSIAGKLCSFFRKCGMSLNNTPGKLYVEVKPINLLNSQ